MAQPATPPVTPVKGSILTKAKSLTGDSLAVLGKAKTGKTTYLIDEVAAKGQKPLWLSFNNLSPLQQHPNPVVGDWDTALITDWSIVGTEVSQLIPNYEALVLDGVNIASMLCLASIAKGGVPSQPDWQNMGNKLRDLFVKWRGQVKSFYITVDVVADDEGKDVVALNRYTYNQLIPLFGRIHYTHTELEVVNAAYTGNVSYKVQKTGVLALDLRPLKK